MPTCPACSQNYPEMLSQCPRCGGKEAAPAATSPIRKQLMMLVALEGFLIVPLGVGMVLLPPTYTPWLIGGMLLISSVSGAFIMKLVFDAKQQGGS